MGVKGMTSRLGKFFRRGACAVLGHKQERHGYDRVVRHSTGSVVYIDHYWYPRCKIHWREAEVYEKGSQQV